MLPVECTSELNRQLPPTLWPFMMIQYLKMLKSSSLIWYLIAEIFTHSHQTQSKLPSERVTVSVAPMHCTPVSTNRTFPVTTNMYMNVFGLEHLYVPSRLDSQLGVKGPILWSWLSCHKRILSLLKDHLPTVKTWKLWMTMEGKSPYQTEA